MDNSKRRSNYDVTNRVRISHPQDVYVAISDLMLGLYPGMRLAPLQDAFDTFTKLYAGTLPGYFGCDTWYHDAQHSLDCALAQARILDGYERTVPEKQRLGEHRSLLGVILALFHDAGYIRKSGDKAENGAEFTLTHVHRSGAFLADYLPGIGFDADVELTRQIVHFTGYEIALDKIDVKDEKDRMLGFMLGSADILAQTADRCYLEKCRDFLYHEFELAGLAGTEPTGGVKPIYHSALELMEKSPEFNKKLWEERLDGYFGKCYRYLEGHFGGENLYVSAIEQHMRRLVEMLREGRIMELRRQPQAINASALREILGLPQASLTRFHRRFSPPVRRQSRAAAVRAFVPT